MQDGNPAKQAVRSLTMAVDKGECFGLLGPNGAGKAWAPSPSSLSPPLPLPFPCCPPLSAPSPAFAPIPFFPPACPLSILLSLPFFVSPHDPIPESPHAPPPPSEQINPILLSYLRDPPVCTAICLALCCNPFAPSLCLLPAAICLSYIGVASVVSAGCCIGPAPIIVVFFVHASLWSLLLSMTQTMSVCLMQTSAINMLVGLTEPSSGMH